MFVDVDQSERLLGDMIIAAAGIISKTNSDFDVDQYKLMPKRGTNFFDKEDLTLQQTLVASQDSMDP